MSESPVVEEGRSPVSRPSAVYSLERAWLGPDLGTRSDVRVEVVDGRWSRVEPGGSAEGAERVVGLALPGFADAHSHAFHRALRGRVQGAGAGSFWAWRDRMYDLAAVLDPDLLHDLALGVYGEMVRAGVVAVGEFHYLHHGPGGRAYDGHAAEVALVEAARGAGLRLTLLDTCYLTSAPGRPPEGPQVRWSDGSAEAWRERWWSLRSALADRGDVVVGAAVHSVRAVPPEGVAVVAEAARRVGVPLHAHVSEQPAENAACVAAYGLTPVQVLDRAGALGPLTTAVHATHLTDEDVALLGGSRTNVCFCPTTERDLGDGVGPSVALRAAGAVLTLGTDGHAHVDLLEEARAVEMDERLVSLARGHWSADELLVAATSAGHGSLGWSDAGWIAVGQRADLVVLDARSVRTAGTGGVDGADAGTAVWAATAADVVRVLVDGREVVRVGDGGDAVVGERLDRAVRRAWAAVEAAR